MALDNLEVARRYLDTFNRHDLDGCSRFIADDGTFTDMVSGRNFDGPAGLREWNQQVFDAYPDASVELMNAVGLDDTVVTECVFRGTQRGALVTTDGIIPPTGNPVELQFCLIGRLRDGKMVSTRQYYDGLALLRQLGLARRLGAEEARPQP